MADMKSMMPDLKDVTSIASKLFKDVKKSVGEIISEYKEKHVCQEKSCNAKTKKADSTSTKTKKK